MEQTLTTILVAELTGLESTGETGGAISDKTLEDHLVAVDRIVTDHHGKLLGNAGGSLAAQFSNPSDAVRCAIVLEETIRSSANDQSIRIGIDQGEVAIENGRVRGDGIKSATALQKRFEGIVISRSVQGHLGDDVGVAVEELSEGGDVAYRVRAKDTGVDAATPPATFRQVLPKFTLVAGGALVLILIVSFAIQDQFSYDFEPADLTKYKFELPEKPSIAVLPFDNLSGDPANDYLGDSLTETIIAALATSSELFVIARNSVFTYKNKPTRVQQIAEELGVRYVLEGSVQVQGSEMRVVAQLVDALDGQHLWADQYDHDLTDYFQLQDILTGRIFEELQVELAAGQFARNWFDEWRNSPDALAIMQRFYEGRTAQRRWDVEGHEKAGRLWRENYLINPDDPGSNVLMGWHYHQKFMMGLTSDPAATFAEARRYADRAIELDEGEATADALILKATLDKAELKHESALSAVEKALELAPGHAPANAIAAWIKIKSGQVEEGVALMRKAMRLEPRYPLTFPTELAIGLIMLGKYEEAKAINESIMSDDLSDFWKSVVLMELAVIAVFQNDFLKAREYVREWLEFEPDANAEKSYKTWWYDYTDQEFVKKWFDALARAGFPQHPPNSNDG